MSNTPTLNAGLNAGQPPAKPPRKLQAKQLVKPNQLIKPKQHFAVPEFLRIKPLTDPSQNYQFHDPRSVYVERFWMSVLGPSSVWFLRLIAREFDAMTGREEAVIMELSDLARRLGLGFKGGRNSALMRTIERSCAFDMANRLDNDTLEVRAVIPPLPAHLHNRLTESLREEVTAWSRTHDVCTIAEEEARVLSKSLLNMGHGLHETAERLLLLNVDLPTAQRATAWTWADTAGHPSGGQP